MDTMKRALRIVIGDKPLAYHPYLARILGGVSGGVWFGQLLYWDSCKFASAEERGENFDGWFYKSEPEIILETALTRRECQAAKVRAKELGLVETQTLGIPPTSHYRINFDVLEQLIEQMQALRSIAHHRAINRAPSRDQSRTIARLIGTVSRSNSTPEYTETTTETTAKSNIAPNGAPTNENSLPVQSLSSEERANKKFDALPRVGNSGKVVIPPAVVVFRAVRSRYPPRETYQMIADAVGNDASALDLWRQILIAYAAKGYNRQSVTGPLDYFKRGEIPQGGNGKDGKPKRESKLEQFERVLGVKIGRSGLDHRDNDNIIDGIPVKTVH